MRSYKQIQADVARLRREAQAMRQRESATVVERLKGLIARYGITAAELGFEKASPATATRSTSRAATRKTGRHGPARYRDPVSGRTWTGVGRVPQWLVSVGDREAYRIEQEAAEEPQQAAKPSPRAQPTAQAGARKTARARKTTGAGKTGARKAAAAKKASAGRAAPARKRTRARASQVAAPGDEAPAPVVPEGSDASPAEGLPAADAAA